MVFSMCVYHKLKWGIYINMELKNIKIDANYKTQHDSVIIISKRGKIKSHQVIKKDEEIVVKRKSKEITTAQKESLKNRKDIINFIQGNEGRFIHNIYKYKEPYMLELENNIDIIRFIVLASYSTFGGRLFDKNNNEIKKSSLKNIWDVKNRASINETYEKLKEVGYITESEEGYIMINQDIFVKGEIQNWKQLKKENGNFTYTRIFTDNIQDMYYNCKDSERKRLANFFKLLPYINFKYNVLCNNPTETDETKLETLNWRDLAVICGVDETNSSRLKRDLMKLKIFGYEVIGQFETGNKKSVCVNPKVYYSGNDADCVRHLYSMFKMHEN